MARRGTPRAPDLTNTVIGDYLVLARAGRGRGGRATWRCACLHCDATLVLTTDYLRAGHPHRCPHPQACPQCGCTVAPRLMARHVQFAHKET